MNPIKSHDMKPEPDVHYQYAVAGEKPLDPKNRSSDASFANPDEIPDLTDISDSEDDDFDDMDHFESDKKTYGGAPKQPNSSSNVDELAKNAAKLSDTCWINAATSTSVDVPTFDTTKAADFNGATTFDGFRHHCPVAHDVPTSSTSTFADLRHHWPVPHEVPTTTAAKKASATTTAANKKQNMWSKPEKSDGCVNVDKSEENTEEINILSIQTKESTSKSATIAPKIVGSNSKPT